MVILPRNQGRHGQKNSNCIDSLLLTLVRLLQWSDGGKKADWIGLSQCVRGQDIESKSVDDSVANYMQCYKQR